MIDAGPGSPQSPGRKRRKRWNRRTFLGAAPVAELRMRHGNIVTAPVGSQRGCALLTAAPQLVDGGASAALALG
jgi:hypothetical protein